MQIARKLTIYITREIPRTACKLLIPLSVSVRLL